MGVALSDLVPTLRRTLNPPGQTNITASNTEWVGRLADAFWDGRMQDFFIGYVITNDAITPVDPTGPDLGRELQTLIVRYAAIRAIHAALLETVTMSRQKAGNVEVETQRSATLLVALLKDISTELTQIKDRLRNEASGKAIAFLDSMVVANQRVIQGFYGGGGGLFDSTDFGFVN